MTPHLYQPEGDPVAHIITAEIIEELGSSLLFLVKSDGEGIFEVDVDNAGKHSAFISGVEAGKQINGYLGPASLVIASCMLDKDQDFDTLYDLDNEPLKLSA
jgi:hypothetical protein